jgi:glycosyltransferase involved in cell wall biosynthesis
MLKLAAGLARRGYPVDLVLGRAEGPYLAQVPDTLRVVDLAAPRLLAAMPALARYLRREQPTAMLSALDYVNLVALAARRLAGTRTRLVVSERNTLSAAVRHTTSRRTRLMPRLMRWLYPWADAIVGVSAGVADDLAAVTGLPRERITVIHNPVVTPEVAQMAAADVEHPWFQAGAPPVVLGVGRLIIQKDFATLVRAFALVHRRHDAHLVILGDGPERDALGKLVTDYALDSVVDLPGFAENPYPYMARCGVFVLSSRWEGLPGALIEAMFCGAPVIATDCPSGPREVLRDGRHGVLVPVGGVEHMAAAIDRALSGCVPRPSRDGWEPFEQDGVVDRYVEVLLGATR